MSDLENIFLLNLFFCFHFQCFLKRLKKLKCSPSKFGLNQRRRFILLSASCSSLRSDRPWCPWTTFPSTSPTCCTPWWQNSEQCSTKRNQNDCNVKKKQKKSLCQIQILIEDTSTQRPEGGFAGSVIGWIWGVVGLDFCYDFIGNWFLTRVFELKWYFKFQSRFINTIFELLGVRIALLLSTQLVKILW